MNNFNYKDITLSYFSDNTEDQSYQILSMSFLDYRHNIVSLTIRCQPMGRKYLWVGSVSGSTIEYTGGLQEVLEKVYKYYKDNHVQDPEQALLHHSTLKK